MGADEMTDRIAEGSPRLKARMAGACQLLEAGLGEQAASAP
jgi:hypothetical protein